jgi:UDP-N-acetylmuramoyl-L-alanyl-D-glutamate--2,6-diaminopimelate ligase
VIILKDILYKVAIEASGSKEVAVHKIEFDSRKIEVNDVLSLFVVLFQTGMIIFKSNRTRAIVCDTFPGNLKKELHIQVLDTNRALAFMGLIISVTV